MVLIFPKTRIYDDNCNYLDKYQTTVLDIMKDEKESKISREISAAVLDSQQYAHSLNKQGIIFYFKILPNFKHWYF